MSKLTKFIKRRPVLTTFLSLITLAGIALAALTGAGILPLGFGLANLFLQSPIAIQAVNSLISVASVLIASLIPAGITSLFTFNRKNQKVNKDNSNPDTPIKPQPKPAVKPTAQTKPTVVVQPKPAVKPTVQTKPAATAPKASPVTQAQPGDVLADALEEITVEQFDRLEKAKKNESLSKEDAQIPEAVSNSTQSKNRITATKKEHRKKQFASAKEALKGLKFPEPSATSSQQSTAQENSGGSTTHSAIKALPRKPLMVAKRRGMTKPKFSVPASNSQQVENSANSSATKQNEPAPAKQDKPATAKQDKPATAPKAKPADAAPKAKPTDAAPTTKPAAKKRKFARKQRRFTPISRSLNITSDAATTAAAPIVTSTGPVATSTGPVVTSTAPVVTSTAPVVSKQSLVSFIPAAHEPSLPLTTADNTYFTSATCIFKFPLIIMTLNNRPGSTFFVDPTQMNTRTITELLRNFERLQRTHVTDEPRLITAAEQNARVLVPQTTTADLVSTGDVFSVTGRRPQVTMRFAGLPQYGALSIDLSRVTPRSITGLLQNYQRLLGLHVPDSRELITDGREQNTQVLVPFTSATHSVTTYSSVRSIEAAAPDTTDSSVVTSSSSSVNTQQAAFRITHMMLLQPYFHSVFLSNMNRSLISSRAREEQGQQPILGDSSTEGRSDKLVHDSGDVSTSYIQTKIQADKSSKPGQSTENLSSNKNRYSFFAKAAFTATAIGVTVALIRKRL